MLIWVACLCKQHFLAVDFTLTLLLPFKGSDIIYRHFKVVLLLLLLRHTRVRASRAALKPFTFHLIFLEFIEKCVVCLVLQTGNQIRLEFVSVSSQTFLHVDAVSGGIAALLLEACEEDIMLYCQEAFTVCHISAGDVYRRVIIIS